MPRETGLKKSRLHGLTPSLRNINKRLRVAKLSHAEKRMPLMDLNPKIREHVSYFLTLLEREGAAIPKLDKDTMFISTGPNNWEVVDKKGNTASVIFSGTSLLVSINGSPRKKMSKKEMSA